MKSNSSPSAPLNLCPPTGVTDRTVKCVSYFYPTSDNAKRFNLPNGGYDVNLTTFSGDKSKPKTVAAFATKAEAMEHAAVLPHPWASWMGEEVSPASPVEPVAKEDPRDAKIKALEQALKSLVDYVKSEGVGPSSWSDEWVAARAALALPCAPLGS